MAETSTNHEVVGYSGSAEERVIIEDGRQLATWLGDSANEGRPVVTHLRASDRVIARVTDGIYREPASALRELISNAWDADANLVTILTDAPRFSRITVGDDGVGMSYEMLSRLVHNIGGSAKRTHEGQALHITSGDDPDRTPGGRPLIGKIGIGLFSISQLARRFRIVTKVQGENYRLVAEMRLRAYSEDPEEDEIRDSDDTYVSGEVQIVREHAEDLEAHGTDIIIEDVKPRVRDVLRSADRWRALEEKESAQVAGDLDAWVDSKVEEPRYHAGWIRELKLGASPAVLTRAPNLPWEPHDPPEVRMGLLMDAVAHEDRKTARPELATTLDMYLQTLWTLGLSSPVAYVEKHPFELTGSSGIQLFWLSNEPRKQAMLLPLAQDQTVREAVRTHAPGAPELQDGLPTQAGTFTVRIDGVELRRPVRFQFAIPDRAGLDNPLLFVGKYDPHLKGIDSTLSGGDLQIEGYLFWNTRIIPKENNGVLIRIRGVSGALFDSTFMKYQVSEQTRLRQITSELYVGRGLDAALNIDRESFNFSHPHVQLVALWLHRAIRQLTNKHKDLTAKIRSERRAAAAAESNSALAIHTARIWSSRRGTEPLPEIRIAENEQRAEEARRQGFVALSRTEVPSLAGTTTPVQLRAEREAKAQALVQVLSAYDVLTDRPYAEQQELVDAILAIFYGPSND